MQMSKPKDLAPKRLEQLRGILGQDRVVRVEELTEQLGVSSATIRRDLGELEKLGELRRVYGGAVSTEAAWMNRCLTTRPPWPPRKSGASLRPR
jgi:DeoR/GlpR family transcriptional regulator of sugar metabolism